MAGDGELREGHGFSHADKPFTIAAERVPAREELASESSPPAC
jgi:hypothetical protein